MSFFKSICNAHEHVTHLITKLVTSWPWRMHIDSLQTANSSHWFNILAQKFHTSNIASRLFVCIVLMRRKLSFGCCQSPSRPLHLSWTIAVSHDDVIKWKYFPRCWPFVRGIHRSPVNSPHKGQWRGTLMFSLNCVWINSWINDGEAGDLRRSLWRHCNVGLYTGYVKQRQTIFWAEEIVENLYLWLSIQVQRNC